MKTLRSWQATAQIQYEDEQKDNFLLNATPGAGKTTCALAIAARYVQNKQRRLVVVVPSTHLKTQWRDAAAEYGIQLAAEVTNRNGREAADFHGMVPTYQQIASNPELHRLLCSHQPTFVILDEPHHIGDQLSWGRSIQYAFEFAYRRLLITGTAFRSDSERIPFVNYDNFRSVPDYSYSYAEALRDGVVRPVMFPSFEGEQRWWTPQAGEQRARFADQIPEQEKMRRLRTALDPRGAFLAEMIHQANQRLDDVRRYEYAQAGGLFFAIDQRHAQDCTTLIERITGETPALAISDETDASETIRRFSRSNQKWLVAVKMVSEGVDIPRLCVGVFATVVQTELYFRQAVGRFVRRLPDGEDALAYIYMPKDDTLVTYVQRIKDERDHVLLAQVNTPPPIGPGGTGGGMAPGFVSVSSEGQADNVYFDHDAYVQAELAEAREIIEEEGLDPHMNDVLAAQLIRAMRARGWTKGSTGTEQGAGPTPGSPPPPPSPDMVLEVQKNILCGQVNHLVKIFRAMTELEFNEAHYLLQIVTGKAMRQRTLAELQRCLQCVQEWMRITQTPEKPNGYEGWRTLAEQYARQS